MEDFSDTPLPNETLAAIFHGLPQSALSQVSYVSRRFRSVAERELYTSITIIDVISEGSPFPFKTLQCCESLIRRSHLLDSVKKFHIRWQTDPNSQPSSTLYLAAVCDELGKVLRKLAFLESLELFLGPVNVSLPPTSLHAIERVLYSCHFPHLMSCSLGAEGFHPYSSVLDTFLAFVPTLRHLKLSDHRAALALPSHALPELISFRGSSNTAAFLLPGRPVRSLSLVGQDSDVTRDNLPHLTQTSVPLRVLDLSAMSVRPTLLRNVSKYLPTVEVLIVRLALRHTLHFALSGIRLLAGLSTVLSSFDRLSHLDLSPTSVDGIGPGNAAEERTLCDAWYGVCPSLRRVIFPSKTEWLVDSGGVWTAL